MPLSQNDRGLDYGGSWADASKGWPEMNFRTEDQASYAHYACWKYGGVPYGSYVLVGMTLRLESKSHVNDTREALRKHPYREGWKERIKNG